MSDNRDASTCRPRLRNLAASIRQSLRTGPSSLSVAERRTPPVSRASQNEADLAAIAEEVYVRLQAAPDELVVHNPHEMLTQIAAEVGAIRGATTDLPLRVGDVHEMMQELPANARRAFGLFLDGHTYRQIANHLGTREEAALRDLVHALSQVRRRLLSQG